MSSTPFHQAQAEGLCLRFPENPGLHREVSYEAAVSMLLRATSMAQTVPFTWGFIDKPPEGQVLLLCLPPGSQYPIDGIRYQDQEVKLVIPAGPNRELEIHEIKYGFIPGSGDTNAWRSRRRYRLLKGGNPQLVLVHYTQGPQTQILPALLNQPVRHYPLRVVNEPAMYVAGEKMGQKVYPQGVAPPPMAGGPSASAGAAMPMQQPGMPMNFSQQQAMVAHQNNNMEMLERRREQERARNRTQSGATRPPPPDDDSGDEVDQISTRTLALNRYRRNHDFMNEVFSWAAFGNKNAPPPPRPYSNFKQSELEERTSKLQAEIDALKAKAADRRAAKAVRASEHRPSQSNISMDIEPEGITV